MRSRHNKRGERGFLTVTGVLMVLVLAAMIFASFKLLPPYINNYQLQDGIENLSRTVTYNRATEEDIRKQVLDEATEIGVDLDPSQVAVVKRGATVDIAIDYYIDVDLYVHQMELHFTPQAGNKIITAK